MSVDLARQADFLDNLEDVGRWLTSIDASFVKRMRKGDLVTLKALRDYLRHTMSAGAAGRKIETFPSGSLSLAVAPVNGKVSVVPSGAGVEKIVSAVLMERLFAEHDGTWRRLKLGHNTACSLAFYDRTRNDKRATAVSPGNADLLSERYLTHERSPQTADISFGRTTQTHMQWHRSRGWAAGMKMRFDLERFRVACRKWS